MAHLGLEFDLCVLSVSGVVFQLRHLFANAKVSEPGCSSHLRHTCDMTRPINRLAHTFFHPRHGQGFMATFRDFFLTGFITTPFTAFAACAGLTLCCISAGVSPRTSLGGQQPPLHRPQPLGATSESLFIQRHCGASYPCDLF